MDYLWYVIVIIVGNSLGAISGMGGGVLIKPLLDTIGGHSILEISFYSTVAVLTMSSYSVLSRRDDSSAMNMPILIYLGLGALVGGAGGGALLSFMVKILSANHLKLVQMLLFNAMLVYALYSSFVQGKTQYFHKKWSYVLVGLFLGGLASFLGIGGGPMNVPILMFCFSFTMKEATFYSLGIIFVSQCSKVVTMLLAGEVFNMDLKMLWVIIPAALLGGYIGKRLSRCLSDKMLLLVFRGMVLAVLVINIYNAFPNL